jgi:nitroreductase
MPETLDLSSDELLTTTRSVRRRLDLQRPVERHLIEECLEIATQAPTGSNAQSWAFVVVTDADKRARIAELYQQAWGAYTQLPQFLGNLRFPDPARQSSQDRTASAGTYLAEHFHEVPVMVIPCVAGRPESMVGLPPTLVNGTVYSSVIQAAWSFQLAARARGLVSCWTTLHLLFEKEVAEILEIPHDEILQTGLICLGHPTGGTDFKPGHRDLLGTKVHWDTW